jgi:3',5'-cyclic AMP phosphodiesterase CpdA
MPFGDKKVFLHLSDIHFMKDLSGQSNYDIDAALRHALEQDAQKISGTLGKVDGILISGDIAFGGGVQEYETARGWIDKLTGILGCDPGFVWCIPGNHDIDQSVQKDFPALFAT